MCFLRGPGGNASLVMLCKSMHCSLSRLSKKRASAQVMFLGVAVNAIKDSLWNRNVGSNDRII
jgi:hypothetical protein